MANRYSPMALGRIAQAAQGITVSSSRRDPSKLIFRDGTGQVVRELNIKNKYEGAIYDTISIPGIAIPGAITAGTPFPFFNNPANKQLIDTNVPAGTRLSAGTRLEVEYIGLYIQAASGNYITQLDDVKRIADGSFLDLKLNRLQMAKKPAFMLPSGYGIVGNSTRVNTETASIGVASTASVRKLLVPQFIEDQQDIEAVLTFYRHQWDAVRMAADGFAELPTIAMLTHVKLMLIGTMYE